jgi:hypothetical protein
MTTIPARHPHRAIDAGADHPKNVFPPIEPAWTRASLLASPHHRRAA